MKVVTGINGGLGAIGLGLLVLFFAMSIFKSGGAPPNKSAERSG